MKQYNLIDFNPDTFVYISNNQVYIKSTAALIMLKDLEGGFKLFFACIIIPRFIRDFFYHLIAKNRYKLWGRKAVCMIPESDISDRFLE